MKEHDGKGPKNLSNELKASDNAQKNSISNNVGSEALKTYWIFRNRRHDARVTTRRSVDRLQVVSSFAKEIGKNYKKK